MLFAAALSGCATILKGSSSTIDITSDPPEATVYVNGQNRGTAPIPINIKSTDSAQIKLVLDGHDPAYTTATPSIQGGYVVLDVLFGLVPILIDGVTGSWYGHEAALHATLTPTERKPASRKRKHDDEDEE